MTKPKLKVPPMVVAAAAAASSDGVGLRFIAKTIGCSASLIKSELRKSGHAGCYTGSPLPVPASRQAAFKHAPLIKVAVKKSGMKFPQVVAKPPAPVSYVPLAATMGVRVYMRPDGISLPHLRSLYGELS